MRVIPVILSMLLASDMVYSLSKDIRQLKIQMDFCLESVIEVQQNIQELRDGITIIQENQNVTDECVNAHCSTDSHKHSPSCHLAANFPSNEQYDLIEILQKGLLDEKAAIRAFVEQQNEALANMAKEMDKVKTEYASTRSFFDVAMAFEYKLVEQHQVIGDVARMVKEQNKEIGDLERTLQVIKANSDIIFVLPSLGFRKYRTSLYKLFNDKITWTEAQQKCQDEGFYLAEVNDEDEFKFIQDWLHSVDVWFSWFGGTDSEVEGTWRWSKSGLKVIDDWWCRNHPDDNDPGKNCMQYSIPYAGFFDKSCDNSYKFMCEFGPFMVRGPSVYKIHMNKVIWALAKQTCHDEGYYLAEMNDDDELDFVKTKVGNHNFWIGGTDTKKQGTWIWVTSGDDVNGSLWAPGAPSNDGKENCMYSFGSNRPKCNNGNCGDKLMFVCEKEL